MLLRCMSFIYIILKDLGIAGICTQFMKVGRKWRSFREFKFNILKILRNYIEKGGGVTTFYKVIREIAIYDPHI